MINLVQPFTQITGPAIIGGQQPHQRTFNQRFSQQMLDIILTQAQIDLWVKQLMAFTPRKPRSRAIKDAVAGINCIKPAALARLLARGLKPDSCLEMAQTSASSIS